MPRVTMSGARQAVEPGYRSPFHSTTVLFVGNRVFLFGPPGAYGAAV